MDDIAYNNLMTMIRVSDVMESENCTDRTVQKWCAANGVKKFGADYVLSAEELEQFRNRKRPGKPRKIIS